jgi:Zn-dependent peptidase ImmA (M78 family)/DNA-binding XRE family transcriptional regulator
MLRLEQIDPKILGQRLMDARKERGITQEDAAKYLDCSRPTMIAIEKGTRAPKVEEIIKLASFYGRQVHEIVREGVPLADLRPHLRAIAQQTKMDDPEIERGISELQKFAEDYSRLERMLNVPLRLNYPQEVQLNPNVNVADLAEDIAAQERRRLGLGDQPVIRLRSVLEIEVGLRILYEDLPSHVAGMFAYSADFGGLIAVNRKHPAERRRATMVHEYGHLITDRYKPGIDYVNSPDRKPANERFAESFAMTFLMPATSVRRRFNQIVNDSSDFQIADLCRLSHFYFVSVEAMTIRLENMSLIPKGVREHLKESRFEVRKAAQILNLEQHPIADDPFPDRYVFLAVQAFERGDLSEGELVSLLRRDRVEVREIVAKFLTSRDITEKGEFRLLQFEQPQMSLLTELKQ